MPTKLTPELCYLAGIVSKTRQGERSMVGINTTIDDVVENFVEVALKLGVDAKKIIIEDVDGVKHVYFFHSKLAKQIREIVEKQTRIFKYKNEFSSSYLAGMFDASGKVSKGKLLLSGMSAADQMVMENLGIHTRQNSITNIQAFLGMIKGRSVIFRTQMGG
ncbi:MAG: hypothetical protein KGH71_05675 [Candidatus Micrarchaeota archaeon]|nr:hypothetical protein [Candidatus Micrarchaeota archaeon]